LEVIPKNSLTKRSKKGVAKLTMEEKRIAGKGKGKIGVITGRWTAGQGFCSKNPRPCATVWARKRERESAEGERGKKMLTQEGKSLRQFDGKPKPSVLTRTAARGTKLGITRRKPCLPKREKEIIAARQGKKNDRRKRSNRT